MAVVMARFSLINPTADETVGDTTPGRKGRKSQPGVQAVGWSIAVILVGSVFGIAMASPMRATNVERANAIQALRARATDPGATTQTTVLASVPAPVGTAASTSAPATAAPTTATGRKRSASTTAAGATRTTTGPPSAPTQRLQPSAGSYPVRITGTSSAGGKAVAVPAQGSLVVAQRSSTDQQQTIQGLPGGLVLVVRAVPAGVDLVSFSLSAASHTLTFRPPAPVPFVRTDAAVGQSWQWQVRTTDPTLGTVTVDQRATVTATGNMTVGGTSVPVVTIDRVFTVSGSHVNGTVQLTSVVSLIDRLPLIEHEVVHVTASVLFLTSSVVSDLSSTLTSIVPQ